MIGLAAAWLILQSGHVLGASGLLGGLIPPRAKDYPWRAEAILGLIVAPLVARFLFHPHPPMIRAGWATLMVGGLLVGLGTRLANGCTSGHGVCGLAPRSLAATATFMAAGFATVFFVRHVF